MRWFAPPLERGLGEWLMVEESAGLASAAPPTPVPTVIPSDSEDDQRGRIEGFKGFVNSDGLVAPRFVLHEWDLFKNGKYDELDDLILKTYVDPFLRLSVPEDIVWASMGEGPHVRVGMEALGMKMGPAFPAQQALSPASARQRREGYEKSGLLDWVDWSEGLWEQAATA